MKKTVLTLILVTLTFVTSIAQNNGSAPKIISTVPSFGDCHVDTSLREIIVKFDQDMNGGMSVVDTPNTPEITEMPTWTDKRTISILVKLYPDKKYSLQFNSGKYQNFKNTAGVSLNPDNLIFYTGIPSTVKNNKKAFIEFTEIFPKYYAYAATKNVNWETLLKENREELENSDNETEFTLKLFKLLKNAHDPHIRVKYNGETYGRSMDFVHLNFNIKEIENKLTDLKVSDKNIVASGIYNNTGYIYIDKWDIHNKALILTAIDRLRELKDLPNLVIDVRNNSGGDERIAKEFASCFVKEELPYEKVLEYNNKTGKFDKERKKYMYVNPNGLLYTGNVYVLSGPRIMSSNESFILMMKQAPNVTVVGMHTYGSSGNPLPYEFSNGVKIYLPSWQACTMDGKPFEGTGIGPDIEVITTWEDFKGKDALFEKVISLIETDKEQHRDIP